MSEGFSGQLPFFAINVGSFFLFYHFTSAKKTKKKKKIL
jgi:hypothetical protein